MAGESLKEATRKLSIVKSSLEALEIKARVTSTKSEEVSREGSNIL